MPTPPRAGADRERLVGRIVGALGGAAVAADGSCSCLLRGPWAIGTSWLLREAAERLRGRGEDVTIVVADGRLGLLVPHLDVPSGRSGRRPVLVVDDAHHLDTADAQLLRDRALNGDRRVLMGARSAMPLADPIEWMAAAGVAEVVPVPPLGDDDARALMEARTGGRVHSGTAHRLQSLAGGRPGFLLDLTEAAIADGTLVHRNGLWRLAGEVTTTLVEARLRFEHRHLDPATAAAHRILSQAGPLPRPVAAEVLGEDGLCALIDLGYADWARGGSIHVAPPVLALATRAQAGDLPADMARCLLERAGPHVSAARRVTWQLAAGELPPEPDVEAAARATWADGDPHGALELVRRVPGRMSAMRLEADLLAEIGQRGKAIEVLERIEAVADAPLGQAAAAERATITMWLGQRDRALAISRASLAASGSSPPALVSHALLALEGGDPAAAAAIVEPLIDDAQGAAAATSVLATAAALQGAGGRSVDLAGRAIDLMGELDLVPDVATITLVLALGEDGRLVDARQVALDGYRAALTASRSAQAWMALCRLRISLLTGELGDASTYGLEAAELFADLDHHAALRWAVAGRLIAAAALADGATAAELDQSLEDLGDSGVQFLEPDVLRARGWGRVAAGDLPGARAWMEAAADRATATGALALAGTALHDLVRVGGAHDAAAALADLRGRVDSGWARPRADHAAGLVAGDPVLLLAAADRFHELGADLHAREAAADSSAAARAAGDRRAERRANTALTQWPACPGAATPALAGVVGQDDRLTPREREVAERAAAGAANRAIAVALGVSVRTVENLLHRSYHKLGVAGREELRTVLLPHSAQPAERPDRPLA